jgi:predicted nucleotidyltransferase component of viral defense system
MEYRMNLHDNTDLFAELLTAASQPEERGGLGIRQAFLEKDYWVTRSLQMLAESRFSEQAVFKGGTSISKACGVGFRFSEDIDIAIVADETRKDNQTKALVGGIGKVMSTGLTEVEMPDTRKFSKYRKVYYQYPELTEDAGVTAVKAGIIQLEVVSFANPYPYEKKRIGSLVRDFLLKAGREDMVEQYDLGDFELNVLDVRRTATEKLVSLMRQSLGDDYMGGLRSKIRHFYDLHYLWGDETCRNYLMSEDFRRDFGRLLAEDQARFKEPEGWQQKRIGDSPLLADFDGLWKELAKVYEAELPGLAYRPVPDAAIVAGSMAQVLDVVRKVEG